MATVNKIDLNGDTYDIESSALVTTQPTNPSEGATYYDTVNDVIKVYDGANWNVVGDGSADINTKTFYLASDQDLTTAQAALDWYLAGKNPIIVCGNVAYMMYTYNNNRLIFASVSTGGRQYQNSCTETFFGVIMLEISQGTVTNIIINESIIQRVLSTNVNYSTPYTPQYNGSPATKKYVDDSITGLGLGTAATKNTGTSSGNVPVLDSNGKLANSTLPGVALTDTFTVSTSSDLTTLSSADQGDLAIVTSENKTYVLSQAPYSTASNWKQILSPTGGVTSVNGQTGAVTLSIPTKTSDITNDSGFLTSSTGVTSVNGSHGAVTGLQTTANLKTSLSDNSDSYYPSQKAVKTAVDGKQDSLATQTAYTSKGTATKVPQITTNSLGQVTGITEVTITHPSQVSDTAYASSWDGVTTTAPSKNAVYDKIESLNLPIVSSTAPSSPTEGMIWYDTTNDKLKTYNGSSWDEAGSGGDTSNTKTFYLADTDDLTNAQAAYDWFVAGKNPIISYAGFIYTMGGFYSSNLHFSADMGEATEDFSDSELYIEHLALHISSGSVTSITDSQITAGKFLDTNTDYATPYTPTYNGSPATKKYVDDSVSVVSGDSGTTYTIKVSNSAPASGTPNTTITFVV